MEELDELITYIENDLIGKHKDIGIIDEAIKKYAELYHKKQLKLCDVVVSLPKFEIGQTLKRKSKYTNDFIKINVRDINKTKNGYKYTSENGVWYSEQELLAY